MKLALFCVAAAFSLFLLTPYDPSHLEARASENAVIRDLNAIHAAQTQFKAIHDRAATLDELETEHLLKLQANRYIFRMMADGSHYRVTATPHRFFTDGRRTFFSDDSLEIRESWDPSHPADASSPLFGTPGESVIPPSTRP